MSHNIHSTFVSQKISKIRWKPDQLDDSEYFITGSTEDYVNQVCIWAYPAVENDPDIYPRLEKSISLNGDVTEIRFVHNDVFVVSSSAGFIKAFKGSYLDLAEIQAWENLHYFKTGETSSCTSLATFDEDIATVGEDGRIILLTLNSSKPLRKIDKADSCSLRCVTFLKHNELLTGNLRGQLKMWDLRSNVDKPLSTFMLSADQVAATCVTHHPTQSHMLLAGGEDGTITVWDLRKSTYPVNVLNAHETSVNEIVFHPERPEHLFTCSFGGDVWHWNTHRGYTGDETSWLSSDSNKRRLEVVSLMGQIYKSINSIDVNRTRLVCGCDNEAIYIIQNLNL